MTEFSDALDDAGAAARCSRPGRRTALLLADRLSDPQRPDTAMVDESRKALDAPP